MLFPPWGVHQGTTLCLLQGVMVPLFIIKSTCLSRKIVTTMICFHLLSTEVCFSLDLGLASTKDAIFWQRMIDKHWLLKNW